MPRRFAPLKTAIWSDDDFQTLSPLGQRMYMQVLSQKRLSLCGVVPYAPRNWARGCSDLTVDDIEAHLAELVDRDYVYIDHDTEELLVRTMVKHDPPRGARSIAGMWNDWLEIDSVEIRERVVHSVPDEIWHHEHAQPPESAKPLRKAPLDGASGTRKPIENEQGASSILHPPATCHQPSSSMDDDPRFRAIVEALADDRIKRHPARDNPLKYRTTVVASVIDQQGDAIRAFLASFHPDADADQALRRIRAERRIS